MAPALHLLNEAGGTENEDRRTDEQPGVTRKADVAGAFEAGIGLKIKLLCWADVSH
jgi:hypothetical protein